MVYSKDDLKLLREKTAVPMLDCKNALNEANGDIEKAVEILRKKGIKVAKKKASRSVKDGVVDAYIHLGSKLGVLIEVNCETDFVARNEEFKELTHDLAMHVAAKAPRYITREEVSQDVLDKEREILKAQFKGKPENVLNKIIDGKLNDFYKENCLLEQVFVKDDKKIVKDLITEKIAKFGENVVVKRFVRFGIKD